MYLRCQRRFNDGKEHRFYSIAEKVSCAGSFGRVHDSPRATIKFLRGRWEDLFGLSFEVLLYGLTSTYFESEPPANPEDKRRFGYSRDKRSDCVQVVIALVVTPEGFPLAYEVMPGNTSDKTTLKDFLAKIQTQYGKARRIWVMDRGIPTEEALRQMRASDPVVQYVVGTPKGRLSALEAALLPLAWQQVRPRVQVKLLPQAPATKKGRQQRVGQWSWRLRKDKLREVFRRAKVCVLPGWPRWWRLYFERWIQERGIGRPVGEEVDSAVSG